MSNEKSVRNPFFNGSRIDDIEVNENRGPAGPQGLPGYSPSASVTQTANGARISITDKNGTTYADISNGRNGVDGNNGTNGFSPLASVQEVENGVEITVTDNRGTTTAVVRDGERGERGEAGFSPIASVEEVEDGAQLTVTDENGTTTALIRNGEDAFNPLLSIEQVENGVQFTVTDINGTTTATLHDGERGQQGQPGDDGFSPTVDVTETATGHTVTITDKDGWYSFEVENGVDGQNGQNGQNGLNGVAATVQIGNVETLAAGSSAYVVNIGDENAAILDIGIPQGAQGIQGEAGQSNIDSPGTSSNQYYLKIGQSLAGTIDGNSFTMAGEYSVGSYTDLWLYVSSHSYDNETVSVDSFGGSTLYKVWRLKLVPYITYVSGFDTLVKAQTPIKPNKFFTTFTSTKDVIEIKIPGISKSNLPTALRGNDCYVYMKEFGTLVIASSNKFPICVSIVSNTNDLTLVDLKIEIFNCNEFTFNSNYAWEMYF